jgi:glycosyltransferase involved in cell wall biosynthesis
MRIVHVAPRLAGPAAGFNPAVQDLALAQAKASSGRVQIAATAAEPTRSRISDLELRALPGDWPRWLGGSRALRHHLANCPLELVHAHCPGERSLHYAHLAAQRHGAPLVISPALAFGLGPRARLRLRCTLGRLLVHPQALEHAAGWHATSAEEANAIRACGFAQPICVAPPGVPAPTAAALAAAREEWLRELPALAGRPVALCTAPLARRSRLRELIALWGEADTGNWLLLIVGHEGDETVAALRAHAAAHRAADRVLVTLPCARPPHAIARLLLSAVRADTALGPVATALAAGLPALVADDAPWSRLAADQAGWCVPWSAFGAALGHALELPPDGLAEFGLRARDLARREFDWARTAEHLLTFYRNLRS